MIFDKNAKRIKELSRKDPVRYAGRIKELKSRGPEFWIRYFDKQGVPHDEKCPGEYNTATKAERYYKIMAGKVDEGSYTPRTMAVTVSQMCDYFLDAKKKKAEKNQKWGGYRSSKTLCGHIKRHIGQKTLNHLIKKPDVLIDLFDDFPESAWAPKYRWNYYKELRAIISLWIRRKLLNIPNPMDAVECPDAEIKTLDHIPTQAEYEAVLKACREAKIDIEAIRLIGAVRYSGLRVNEVLKWQIPDVVLYPSDNGIPYFWTIISKQKRKMRVPRPMARELYQILVDQISDRIDGSVWKWKYPPYKLVAGILEKARVKFTRPFHDYRKTVKIELKRKGIDREKVKEFQGHKTNSMDEYYTIFQREDLEEAVRDSWNPCDQPVTKIEKG